MISKKAQILGKIAGIVVVLAVVLILALLALRGGTFFSKSFESVASCQADRPVGFGGECDCFYDGECPGGSHGVVHPDCPRALCSDSEDYEAKKELARQNFEEDVERIEDEIDGKLKGTMLRVVESKHFGQCCQGAEPYEEPGTGGAGVPEVPGTGGD